MGQSIGSVGSSHKQSGAANQSKNQPEVRPGQKMAEQGGAKAQGKPDGGADHGPRSRR
jgi:hypothetical protein